MRVAAVYWEEAGERSVLDVAGNQLVAMRTQGEPRGNMFHLQDMSHLTMNLRCWPKVWSLLVYRLVHAPVTSSTARKRGSTPRQRDSFLVGPDS